VCILWHMKRTNIFFPELLLVKLRALADATGLSVAELIRRAVDEYLKRQK
jgi:CopG-like RHH_1 or ribbon-helix-helix domain, RHH_5